MTDRKIEHRAQSAGEALDPAGTGEDHIGDVNELIGKLDMIAKFETAPISVRDRCREAAALIRAQASALAGARRSALTQASELVMRRREAIRNGGARNVLMYLADEIRALTEPQHGNG